MISLQRRLLDAKVQMTGATIRGWCGEAELRNRLGSTVAQDLALVDDHEFAAGFMGHAPVQGVDDPTAYNNRVVELADGSLALAGIRFRGRDMAKPFVDLLVLEGQLSSDRLARVVTEICEKWSEFSPLCCRMTVPSVSELDSHAFGPQSRPDQRIIAGQVAVIKSEVGRAVPGLTARRATDLSWYPHYEREYADFLQTNPAATAWTQPEDREDLQRALDQDLLFEVIMDSEPVGVVAVPRGSAQGMRGFRVQEKLLYAGHRGRGLAGPAERAVINQLPDQPGDAVFGSIEEHNLPSRRSAYSVGRADVAARVWLTPPSGYSGMPLG